MPGDLCSGRCANDEIYGLMLIKKHDSIDRKHVNIEGKPENIEGKPVRQCRGCVRSQQLWISSWQQEPAGPDPGFNILPAVPRTGCQLARPWLAQVGSTDFSWKSGRFSACFLLTLWPSFSQGCGPFCLFRCCCGASFEESCSL